ncbi:restriction endonuclease [Asanoa siamensis]|uniref:Restriction endonuclease n=1 Tax=Asanoa siamensis TaxID=926357 RepID=A0ABQ4CI94_9ACTN|nr:restriction endonuclease [Asanoa siamensis]GIF71013.1 restriction endonuclease [Asanoa siamensis]
MDDPELYVPFDALSDADLMVDAIYRGGSAGSVADDPLGRLLPVGNQGGFRYKGSVLDKTVRLAVLYTSGFEPDWPDELDEQTGVFTYYGDNRRPGQELHVTRRRGNMLLRDVFAACHASAADRAKVPPILLFAKAGSGGRDVRFRGLLAPGAATLTANDDLQAIWRSTAGKRFQNYQARFTVLDQAVIRRSWLDEVLRGSPLGEACPKPWREWVNGRSYHPLVAPSTKVVRTRDEQLPSDGPGQRMLETIHRFFAPNPHGFERCAVELWRMMSPATGAVDVTRASRDGGRDAVGVYHLGPAADRIAIDFALEAKCYARTNSVGVTDISRLISRLRHRNFGVFVTTSYFHHQAYGEIRADQHPIALICGGDIVDILRRHGHGTPEAVHTWLSTNFADDKGEAQAAIRSANRGRP